MPRRASWPPRIQWNRARNADRIRVRGVDYHLGPHGSAEAKKEYARLCLELAGNGASNPTKEGDIVTVAVVALRWREHALKKFGESNPEVGDYDRALAVVLEIYRDLPVAEFDVDCLESVRERMIDPAGRNWCRTNTNRRITRIRTVWRWAERKKLAPKGSWEHLRTLEALPPAARGVRETAPRKPCSEEELQAVVGELRQPLSWLLELCWWTGARPGEFRLLLAGEVDRSGEDWVCRPARHKNAWRGHKKAIVLGPEARRILEALLEGKGDQEYVFTPTGKQTPYSRQGLTGAVSRAAKRAGVTLHSYQCRHAMKRRVTREYGLDCARAVLGQKSIMTTDGYDGQGDEELARRAARKLG